MGGCCGAVKTGQKSLPDKKKPLTDVNQEKSNGAQAVSGTETTKTPVQEADQDERSPRDTAIQKQESIVAPVKVSLNTAEFVKGEGEEAPGSENVMDMDTAVAPFEGVISNDQPQLDIQGKVASTDSELLLPYQIPVQHTLNTNTTTTTITTIKHEEFQLRVDEPLLDESFQDADFHLLIKESGLASSVVDEVELPPPSSAAEVETITRMTRHIVTEAIPTASVELDAGGSGELNIEEPVALVEKSFSLEAQRPLEGILPYVELKQNDLIQEVAVDADVSLPTSTSGLDTIEEPEPILAICPPAVPEPSRESLSFTTSPPVPSFEFSELEHQLITDGLEPATISEAVHNENKASLVQEPAEFDLQHKDVADLEISPDPVKDVLGSHEPASVQEIHVDVDEQVSAGASFEVPSTPELHHEPELGFPESASQQLEDYPPPVPQEQAEGPLVAIPAPGIEFEPGTLPTDYLQETVLVENAVENLPPVEVAADIPVAPLPTDDNVEEKNDTEIDFAAAAATFQLVHGLDTEPESYQVSQTEEQQQPQSYQEQKPEEPAPYQDGPSATESIDQVPGSVVEAPDVILSSEDAVTPAVPELSSEQAQEGGQLAADSEVPVLELVPDQAQQSRQAWWEQNGSEPGPDDVDPAALSSGEATLPPIPLQQEFSPVEPSFPQSDHVSSIPSTGEAVVPTIPAEIETVSPSSDSFPELIPEPLPSSFDQGATEILPEMTSLAGVESADVSAVPTENGEVSQSSDEASSTPASVVSPEGSTPTSSLSPEGVDDSTASSKEPIYAQA